MINAKYKHKAIHVISVILLACISFFTVSLMLSSGEKIGITNVYTENTSQSEETLPQNTFIEGDAIPSVDKDKLIAELNSIKNNSVVSVVNTSLLSSDKFTLKGAGLLASEGYHTTSLNYNSESFIIAKMIVPADLPDVYSLRNEMFQTLEYKQDGDYSDFEAVYTDAERERAAVKLYMGYWLVDNGVSTDLYSSSGQFLMTYNDTEYFPAYERDKNGLPLFYKYEEVETGLFDGESLSKDEDGELVKEPHEKDENAIFDGILENEGKGNPVKETVKVYYTLSYYGNYFVKSDYNELTDSRGVRFDYPSTYGLADIDISTFVEVFNKYHQDIDGKLTMKSSGEWTFYRYGFPITLDVFDRVYNYSEGRGCVITESYYKDGGMYFLDQYGRRAFNTVKKFNDTVADRYLIENYLPPISNGSESIGYFYYNEGWVRARLETIDYSLFNSNNLKRVYSTKEVLIDVNGNLFDIPSGYNLKAYSNGVLLLEHNGKYGFMDNTGAWIAEPVYKYAEAFSEGLGVLVTEDGRFGMIDTNGDIVLPFAYKHISSSSSGVIAAYSEDGGWEIFRKMTK